MVRLFFFAVCSFVAVSQAAAAAAGEAKKDYLDETVGDMVSKDYRKAAVFSRFGIDFCCGGDMLLEPVCEKFDVKLKKVQKALRKIDRTPMRDGEHHDYDSWELDRLSDHIVDVHHKYVRDAEYMLNRYSNLIANVHGSRHTELYELRDTYTKVMTELKEHIDYEEENLFPAVKGFVQSVKDGKCPDAKILDEIKKIKKEHTQTGDEVRLMNSLSKNYKVPRDACPSYRAYYGKLGEFEKDLFLHIHLENNILMKKVKKMAKELGESDTCQAHTEL